MALPTLIRLPARLAFYAWLKLLRARALYSLPSIPPGSVTVLTVSWNTLEYLKVCTEMVTKNTRSINHIVIDNHSTDGTAEWARQQQAFRYVRLPHNIGHPLALDMGILLARTEYAVTLDVDAFPIRSDWIEQLLNPLLTGAKISGATISNPAVPHPYVHPCCLAIRRADFLRDDLTFWPATEESDVGTDISKRYINAMHSIPMTSAFGPGFIGSIFGGCLYHNWGSTRPGLHNTADDAWADAMKRFVRPVQKAAGTY